MSIRYAAQIRDYDCGPIAILNLMKWVGVRATIRNHHSTLSRICNVTDGFGTSESDISRALSQLKKNLFKFSYKRSPKFNEIINHLNSGGSLIFIFENENGLHACFIPEINIKNDRIVIINGFEGVAKRTVPSNNLKFWLKSGRCKAWLVEKI